jgi:protein involved in polysaccharide export with SLBB domain
MKRSLNLLLCGLLGALVAMSEDSVRRIIQGDVLVINVAEELDMKQNIRVPSDGKITYWLLDPVVVTNKTVAEVRQELYKMLDADYIIKPAISVEVSEFINITGSFVMPGRKELPADRPIDIMDAIALGSGFSPRADKDKIILRRKGQVTTYSKKQLDKLYEQGQRVMIEPDDTLEVRESLL